jgi:A/G-specific adenine glycosylase
VRNKIAVEEPPDQHDRLIEAIESLAEPVTEVDAERVVLALEPSSADTEHDATVADVVDGGRDLRGEARSAKGVRADEKPQACAARGCRDSGEGRPTLQLRVRPVSLVGEQVVVQPDAVEAGSLRLEARVAQRTSPACSPGLDLSRPSLARDYRTDMPSANRFPVAAREAALAWFAVHGRRFAIRDSRDPYAILVSEVMAQQTQIGRAQEYWTRWMAEFPSVADLAGATPTAVLRAWAGLGYNRRAVNLQRAARIIVAEHNGRVPDSIDVLERLPGVGPYTARAVAAIAFGRDVAPIDTNVRRVVSRLMSRAGSVDARRLQSVADASVPAGRAREWTHAVMDVGATFCRSRAPRCAACPLRAWCRYAEAATRPAPGRAKRSQDAREPQPEFVRTTRWLRGRLLATLRDAADGAWVLFGRPVGLHDPEEVRSALAAMARDGLIELDAGDGRRARLPSR